MIFKQGHQPEVMSHKPFAQPASYRHFCSSAGQTAFLWQTACRQGMDGVSLKAAAHEGMGRDVSHSALKVEVLSCFGCKHLKFGVGAGSR